MKNKLELFVMLLIAFALMLSTQNCASPRLVTSVGISSQAVGVQIGSERKNNTGTFAWGFKATTWEGKNKKFAIESEIDGQIFTGNESTELGVTYTAFSKYNITENISILLGGGPTYIVDGGNFDGLAQSDLYGNLRGKINIHSWLIGIEHYSSPFDDDGGINLLTFGKEW